MPARGLQLGASTAYSMPRAGPANGFEPLTCAFQVRPVGIFHNPRSLKSLRIRETPSLLRRRENPKTPAGGGCAPRVPQRRLLMRPVFQCICASRHLVASLACKEAPPNPSHVGDRSPRYPKSGHGPMTSGSAQIEPICGALRRVQTIWCKAAGQKPITTGPPAQHGTWNAIENTTPLRSQRKDDDGEIKDQAVLEISDRTPRIMNTRDVKWNSFKEVFVEVFVGGPLDRRGGLFGSPPRGPRASC
jgi:hypothetical protein